MAIEEGNQRAYDSDSDFSSNLTSDVKLTVVVAGSIATKQYLEDQKILPSQKIATISASRFATFGLFLEAAIIILVKEIRDSIMDKVNLHLQYVYCMGVYCMDHFEVSFCSEESADQSQPIIVSQRSQKS